MRKANEWWPRGRYNGRRIVGLRLDILFDVTIPIWNLCHPFPLYYGRCLGLGPLRIWITPAYAPEDR